MTCILKIELVAHVERFMEFVKLCCSVEGDGELSFLVADYLDKMHEVNPNGHELPRITSVSRLVLDTVQFVQGNKEYQLSSVVPSQTARILR